MEEMERRPMFCKERSSREVIRRKENTLISSKFCFGNELFRESLIKEFSRLFKNNISCLGHLNLALFIIKTYNF